MNFGELDSEDKVEIGRLASWSLSSDKTGQGLILLRDNNLDTYWQSDGTQPHLINMQFEKKTVVQQLSFYYDYKQDESYTPQKISIRGGTSYHDLKDLISIDVEPKTGWANITLEDIPGSGRPPRLFLLQLAIITNQLGGRDTHIRQLKIFSTRERRVYDANEEIPFTAQEFLHYSRIR